MAGVDHRLLPTFSGTWHQGHLAAGFGECWCRLLGSRLRGGSSHVACAPPRPTALLDQQGVLLPLVSPWSMACASGAELTFCLRFCLERGRPDRIPHCWRVDGPRTHSSRSGPCCKREHSCTSSSEVSVVLHPSLTFRLWVVSALWFLGETSGNPHVRSGLMGGSHSPLRRKTRVLSFACKTQSVSTKPYEGAPFGLQPSP